MSRRVTLLFAALVAAQVVGLVVFAGGAANRAFGGAGSGVANRAGGPALPATG